MTLHNMKMKTETKIEIIEEKYCHVIKTVLSAFFSNPEWFFVKLVC